MAFRKVDDVEIIAAWPETPSVTGLAGKFQMSHRVMAARVGKLRAKGVKLLSPDPRSAFHDEGVVRRQKENYSPRLAVNVSNGTVLIGSDPHYLPGYATVAHKAFVKFCRELKPTVIVMNGDLFDGGAVSRWPRIGWEVRPTVKQELSAVSERLAEVEAAAPSAAKVWDLGNHDARYELRLAQVAPEYEGVAGFTLKEHFPLWRACWSVWVNDDVVIKHRFKNGVHAAYNGTLHAGKTLIHGHLHSLKVYPFTDYNGTRYGVDAGTMADVYGGAFEGYLEDSPRSWRSGFVILTFHNGKLLMPELVQVWEENSVQFRGKVINV